MLKYYDEIDTINSREMYLPFSKEKENYIIPNCYYINSKGLLYNCFGADGHKEANLIYTYNKIKDSFYGNRYVSLNDDGKISLHKILIEELETYKRIITTKAVTRIDVMKYVHLDFCDLEDPLLVKLILRIISSKIILLNKFIELENKSENKREDIGKIIDLSKDDIKDILVRYCGFHKIESLENKTITTSSLDLNSFINYFDKGWKIDIVSKISLNDKNDELYRTIVIDNFLKKNPQYSDKIKAIKLTLYKGSDNNE